MGPAKLKRTSSVQTTTQTIDIFQVTLECIYFYGKLNYALKQYTTKEILLKNSCTNEIKIDQ